MFIQELTKSSGLVSAELTNGVTTFAGLTIGLPWGCCEHVSGMRFAEELTNGTKLAGGLRLEEELANWDWEQLPLLTRSVSLLSDCIKKKEHCQIQ